MYPARDILHFFFLIFARAGYDNNIYKITDTTHALIGQTPIVYCTGKPIEKLIHFKVAL